MSNVYRKEFDVYKFFQLLLCILVIGIYQSNVNANPNKKISPWSGTVQFGYTGTGGNSQSNNLTGKLDTLYHKNKWQNTYKLETLFNNSDSKTTAERYAATVEFNYNFKKHRFAFYRNNDTYDKFNTYDLTIVNAIGYGQRIYSGNKITVDAQGGPGYRYARVAGTHTTDKDAILYLSSTLNWQISKTANFQENVNLEAGQHNTMTKSESSLSTDIIGNLGLQVSFTITHNSEIPAYSTKTKKTDYRTDVTLLFSF